MENEKKIDFYKLDRSDSKIIGNNTYLYRIIYQEDFEINGISVKKNDKGGYVEDEDCIDNDGYSYIDELTIVHGDNSTITAGSVCKKSIIVDSIIHNSIIESSFIHNAIISDANITQSTLENVAGIINSKLINCKYIDVTNILSGIDAVDFGRVDKIVLPVEKDYFGFFVTVFPLIPVLIGVLLLLS